MAWSKCPPRRGAWHECRKTRRREIPFVAKCCFPYYKYSSVTVCQYGVFLILRPYKSYLQNLQWKLMKQRIYYLVVVVVDTTWLFSFLRTTSFLKNTSAPFVEKYSGILCKFLTINQREEPVENATQII